MHQNEERAHRVFQISFIWRQEINRFLEIIITLEKFYPFFCDIPLMLIEALPKK